MKSMKELIESNIVESELGKSKLWKSMQEKLNVISSFEIELFSFVKTLKGGKEPKTIAALNDLDIKRKAFVKATDDLVDSMSNILGTLK